MEPTQALDRTIQAAASFFRRHSADAGIGPTFGYFVRHPVAPLNRKRLLLVLEALQAESARAGRPLRVLDLACGAGLFTAAAGSLGHRVLGVDASQREIHLARQFTQEEKLPGAFWLADLARDPEWEKVAAETLGGKPDVILLAYALHHIPEVEKLVQRLGRWLDPGAALLINEENPESPLFRLKHRVRTWIQRDTETEWHRSLAGWTEILEGGGFRVSPPTAADLLPGVGRWAPLQAWSLVFAAHRG